MRAASSGFASGLATILVGLAAASGAGPAHAAAPAWLDALRPLRLAPGEQLVESPEGVGAAEAERQLRAAGYEIAITIPPALQIVRATKRSGPLPAGYRAGVVAEASAPAPALSAPDLLALSASDPFGGAGDALPPVVRPESRPGGTEVRTSPLGAGLAPPLASGLFYGTRWEDLTEFMVGRVAIGIYFPESDGSLDQNRYDWTPALRDSVVRSAVRGFLGWTDHAAARGIPLSFHLEIHPSLPTRYEPISRPTSQEELWIEDMLRPLVGYKSDAATASYDVANGLRARLGAHWAGMVIAVQNDSSSTGRFPDGLIAHARLGGPWFVTPVNNGPTNSASLDYYMRHELAHLFWALDEYPANNAWWSCVLTTGYFNRPNWNSDIPFPGYCLPHVDCFMRGHFPNSLCLFTQEQVGWVDGNGSGLLDFFETRPIAFPDSTKYRLSAGNPLYLRGRVSESAIANQNPYRFYAGDSISVSVIDSILYRVDGGSWISIPSVDGIFDEGEELFDLTLPPLPTGSHTIEWQARNANGRAAADTARTAVTVSGSTGAVDPPGSAAGPLRLVVGPSPGRSIRFTIGGGSRGGPALVRLWSATGALARSWEIPSVTSAGEWTWDGRLQDGGRAPSGVYFVTVDAGGERIRRRVVYLR